MAGGEPHKDQHWIPRSYTASWADTSLHARLGKRVHIYTADGTYQGWRYPAQLFSLPDFYTLPGDRGERDLRTEKALGRIESDFARTRRSVLEKRRSIAPRHKGVIAVFVAALRTRTPQSHAHLTGFWKRVAAKADRMQDSLTRATVQQRDAILRARSIASEPESGSMSLEEVRSVAEMLPGTLLLLS